MPCPCSFDWKLFVDFIKALLSFPVVILVLVLLFLSRYKEEIRKKLTQLTKASYPGGETTFDVAEAITDSVEDVTKSVKGKSAEATQNYFRLSGIVSRAFNPVVLSTFEALKREGKSGWDPVDLLEHKQEWVEAILQQYPDLVPTYGQDAVFEAIDQRILLAMRAAKTNNYGLVIK